jgi:hypothetical protein
MLSKITYSLIVSILTILILLSPDVLSEDYSLEKTINHLLKYVEESRCTFVRNDEEHNSKSAAEHMRNKYDYFKDRINTPEEFIELCASKSTLSGKLYLVRCVGKSQIPSADWLAEELNKYRSEISHR